MKQYKNQSSVFKFLAWGCFLLMLHSSCKKEIVPVLPEDKQATSFNFFPASDVLKRYASGGPIGYTAIYVDHYMTNPIFGGSITTFPFFSFSNSGVASEFPNTPSGTAGVITYAPYNAGGHRLMFTDTTNTVVLDTSLNQPAGSFTSLYFTDKATVANAPAAYKIVAVQEDRSGIAPDKVGVRFVHLSADAGALTCSREKTDGSLSNPLPADLHFGEASAYLYFTADDTVDGLLRFSLDNPINGTSVATGVPYFPGRCYVVVITGFANDQQRQINAGKNPDGGIKYQSITVSRNIRAILRRSY